MTETQIKKFHSDLLQGALDEKIKDKMLEWISTSERLPPVGKIVEVSINGNICDASLFDIDHTKPDVLIRFLQRNEDKIVFLYPNLWRLKS